VVGPTYVSETQKVKGLRFPFSSFLPPLGGIAPKLYRARLVPVQFFKCGVTAALTWLGAGRLAIPSLYGSFIRYSMPFIPGALRTPTSAGRPPRPASSVRKRLNRKKSGRPARTRGSARGSAP
jgi:hypothetical protein